MKAFLDLNGDTLLEVAQYLEDMDLLALAQTCRQTAHVAELYTYWHPHSLSTSRAISAFLPADQIGPWVSYSADTIREAIVQTKRFEKTWNSERVYPKSRVRLERPKGDLIAMPNSRWLVDEVLSEDGDSYSLNFIDGKTGRVSTSIDILEEELEECQWRVENTTMTVSSRNPNEVLLGVVLAVGGWPSPVNVIIFRLIITQNADARLEISKAHIRTFNDVPFGSLAQLHDEYIILEHNEDDEPNSITIGHISSGRLWSWDSSPRRIWGSYLFDEWYIVHLRGSSDNRAIPIHLPSLMTLDASQLRTPASLPKGVKLPIPKLLERTMDAPPYCSFCFVDFDDSKSASSPGETFTIVADGRPENSSLLDATIRSSYSVSIRLPQDPVAEPYGDIVLLSPVKDLPTDEELEPAAGHKYHERDMGVIVTLFMGYIRPSANVLHSRRQGLEVLYYSVTRERIVGEVKITDLYGEGRTRSIAWDGDFTSDEEPFVPTDVTLWDTGVGMILLQKADGHVPANLGERIKADYEVLWL